MDADLVRSRRIEAVALGRVGAPEIDDERREEALERGAAILDARLAPEPFDTMAVAEVRIRDRDRARKDGMSSIREGRRQGSSRPPRDTVAVAGPADVGRGRVEEKAAPKIGRQSPAITHSSVNRACFMLLPPVTK